MNVINFKNLYAKNFKSIGSEEVHFNYSELAGMTYVLGENLDLPELRNGVGKSVVFVDCLLMVLFGKIANTVNNKDLFNRSSPENIGWIKLQLEVNMQEYNIHCVLNRSPKSGNVSISFELYEGEVCTENDITKHSKAATLKHISEEILKSDADTFKNSVILSTSNIQNFFQLPKGIKESYLESVFKLVAFGLVNTDVKKKNNSLKKELNAQREILETVKTQLTELVTNHAKFESDRLIMVKQINKEIGLKKEEIAKLKESKPDVAELNTKLEELNNGIELCNARLETLETERNSIMDRATDSSLITEDLKTYEDELKSSAKKKIKDLEKSIKTVEKQIDKLKSNKKDTEAKREDVESDLDKVEEKIDYISGKISELTIKSTEVTASLTVLAEVRESFMKTVEILCDECTKKTAEHLNFDEDKYKALGEELKALNETVKKLEDAKVPYLEQFTDGRLKVLDYGKQIDDHDKSIDSAENVIVGYGTALDDIANSINIELGAKEKNLRAELLANSKEEISENTRQNKKVNEAVGVLQADVADINQQLSKNELIEGKIKSLGLSLDECSTRLIENTDKVNPFDDMRLSTQKRVDSATDTIKTIYKEQRHYELLSDIFDENGVKRNIVSNIVASLNILIKKYLAEMGTDYTVIFDDQFKYTFYTVTGECDYFSFSSGERRRLDMSVMLAFRDILFTNGFVTNILIVDEVLDSGIDGYALFAVLNILKNKTKNSNLGCIVISHRSEILEELTETFDRVLTVQKSGNTTKLLDELES